MAEIVAHLQEDLRELQRVMIKHVNTPQAVTEEDTSFLEEKRIYLENT